MRVALIALVTRKHGLAVRCEEVEVAEKFCGQLAADARCFVGSSSLDFG